MIGIAVIVSLGCASDPASARMNGTTGFSGKQLFTCSECHDGGVTPVVKFEGPSEMTAGDSATFQFIVQSQSANQLFAGFNVAASAGLLAVAPTEDDARAENGELTHDHPKPAEADLSAAWTFTWRAPLTPGVQTLYGAGVSANGRGTNDGDQVDETSLEVDVTPAPPPGDANCDGHLSAADLTGLAALIGGDAPGTCDLADANCDQTVDEDDLRAVITSLFEPRNMECGGLPPL